MDIFPLPSDAHYGYQSLFDPRPRGHHGTDIFAPEGTPVLAVESGKARTGENPLGGNTVYLTGESGTRYYYAHLEETAPGLTRTPKAVDVGDVVGLVGTTGNAQGKPPHLHLQVKTAADRLVNPFDLLAAVDTKSVVVTPPETPKPKPKSPVVAAAEGAFTALGLLLGMLFLFGGRRGS